MKTVLLLSLSLTAGAIFSFTGPAHAETGAADATVGEDQEEMQDIRKVFLRDSTVILKPGQFQWEQAVTYENTETNLPGVRDDTMRMVSFPFTLRGGIVERTEMFVTFPIAYAYREITDAEEHVTDKEVGVGDFSGGLSILLSPEMGKRPDVIATLTVRAPTGSDPYGSDGQDAHTGAGHWAFSAGLQFVKSSDPLILFAGLSYTWQTEEEGLGQEIQPGGQINYNMGLGFAVNDSISLTSQFIGSYQAETEFDGREIPGSSQDPLALRLALTGRYNRDLYIEPSVIFGLNDDASETILSCSLINRWN